MELKLERLQTQLAAAQRSNAAAAAATAAANAPVAPVAAAAQEAAAAAAGVLATQLRSELNTVKSELAASQSRAARAELELAVARTKVLVAQQVGRGRRFAALQQQPGCMEYSHIRVTSCSRVLQDVYVCSPSATVIGRACSVQHTAMSGHAQRCLFHL
jgi:pyruvate/2-oxoglutarate dehydrogenase complex dihydrolipoamide acyltransferase (E2) component